MLSLGFPALLPLASSLQRSWGKKEIHVFTLISPLYFFPSCLSFAQVGKGLTGVWKALNHRKFTLKLLSSFAGLFSSTFVGRKAKSIRHVDACNTTFLFPPLYLLHLPPAPFPYLFPAKQTNKNQPHKQNKTKTTSATHTITARKTQPTFQISGALSREVLEDNVLQTVRCGHLMPPKEFFPLSKMQGIECSP